MSPPDTFVIRRPRFHLPVISGVIERRLLLNFRCDPAVLARRLPPPFRPQLVAGRGLAGICLIRLGGMRPAGLPAFAGLTSENAAHRIAVEWDENGVTRAGVFIPRRDTNAWLNRVLGGRLFPGLHNAATFDVRETKGRFQVDMRSRDGQASVRVAARVTEEWPAGSVFPSLAAASEFFRAGSLGWSPRASGGEFDGLELHCREWRMEPLAVEQVESGFFSNAGWFPPGSVEFDGALLMRGIAHAWHACGRLSRVVPPAPPEPHLVPPPRPHLHRVFFEMP